MNDTTINLVLATTDGYTITVPSGLISTFTITQDGAETVTASFDFRSNGAFSVI